MLELRKLLDKVDQLSQDVANRQQSYRVLIREAREALASIAVDDDLAAKIQAAITAESTWRGAEPLEGTLDRRVSPQAVADTLSLIGVDGSQIYPDRHGPVMYYLLNMGSIVLRAGSGQAPLVDTQPELFFSESDMYDKGQNLVNNEWVNSRRELAEMRTLADLAQAERQYHGGDLEPLILAAKDGQLMMWLGERENSAEKQRQLQAYIAHLQRMQQAQVIPIGFVGRPRSANVVRLLRVAQLQRHEITREAVKHSKYRALTDQAVFSALLGSNQRSALFASTAKINRENSEKGGPNFKTAGQRICFFYLNIARSNNPEAARIVRVDLPEWAAMQPELVDKIQNALYDDCEATHFPYVLVRADELAVVTQQEKRNLDSILAVAISHTTGDMPLNSAKANAKVQSRQHRR
ncbi:MAG: DNA double-strand break repair nuclease NurA [Chloroflexi bacterium]|nr:DNA double-strand break repair nuclease NurA [Chloroflexota bacterium]